MNESSSAEQDRAVPRDGTPIGPGPGSGPAEPSRPRAAAGWDVDTHKQQSAAGDIIEPDSGAREVPGDQYEPL
jgi:hypothetical protein